MKSKIMDENLFGVEPAHLQQLSINKEGLTRRMKAYEVYRQVPMPTKKDRAWRKTNIDDFNARDYLFQPQAFEKSNHKIEVEKEVDETIIHYHSNGGKGNHKDELDESGILICSLMEAEEKHSQLLANIAGKIVLPQESKFSALTQMLDSDGMYLRIAKGRKVETPIHLIIEAGLNNKFSTFHLVIELEEDSTASILTEWKMPKNKAKHLFTGVVEMRAGKNTQLGMTELQSWPMQQWTFLHERAELHENSQLNWCIYADGGNYSRVQLAVNLAGSQANAKITGICLNANPAQLDFDTFQHHRAEGARSDLLFNSAFANHSRSVWTGMIRVEQDAKKTDTYQANRNLILCGSPLIESIPGLEILTDDVRCSHGVSIGEMDVNQLFYLASRGIPEKEAKQLIAQGFLNSGLERIANENMKKKIEKKMQSGLEELFCE